MSKIVMKRPIKNSSTSNSKTANEENKSKNSKEIFDKISSIINKEANDLSNNKLNQINDKPIVKIDADIDLDKKEIRKVVTPITQTKLKNNITKPTLKELKNKLAAIEKDIDMQDKVSNN